MRSLNCSAPKRYSGVQTAFCFVFFFLWIVDWWEKSSFRNAFVRFDIDKFIFSAFEIFLLIKFEWFACYRRSSTANWISAPAVCVFVYRAATRWWHRSTTLPCGRPSNSSSRQWMVALHFSHWSPIRKTLIRAHYSSRWGKFHRMNISLLNGQPSSFCCFVFHIRGSSDDRRRISSGSHAPVFTVVMRSLANYPTPSKQLECHAFVCQTPENAIVIAATLYQCLLAHMGNNQQRPRKPRNQNGVSCVSIASSSMANRRYGSRFPVNYRPRDVPPPPPRPARMKRTATSSLSGDSDHIVKDETAFLSSSDQRKLKSHKTKRAPPVPTPPAPACECECESETETESETDSEEPEPESLECKKNQTHAYLTYKFYRYSTPNLIVRCCCCFCFWFTASELYNMSAAYRVQERQANRTATQTYTSTDQLGGDILTRVAIPRSGSFLNTSGLARYKSRATRRPTGKCGGGGG